MQNNRTTQSSFKKFIKVLTQDFVFFSEIRQNLKVSMTQSKNPSNVCKNSDLCRSLRCFHFAGRQCLVSGNCLFSLPGLPLHCFRKRKSWFASILDGESDCGQASVYQQASSRGRFASNGNVHSIWRERERPGQSWNGFTFGWLLMELALAGYLGRATSDYR